MGNLGFSTGALAYGDFRRALEILSTVKTTAIELSALRMDELVPLVGSLDDLNLRRFQYIAFHAPTKFAPPDECRIVDLLRDVAERGWPIIIHPDAIYDPEVWKPLGSQLCIENMDKRKPIGRTARELGMMFDIFPEADLCFDIGHAHQIDRTMTEARLIVQRYGSKIRQVHISEVNTSSQHVPLSASCELAFAKVIDLLADDIPLIIESIVTGEGVRKEIEIVAALFERHAVQLLETD
jgi:hypothetical protein